MVWPSKTGVPRCRKCHPSLPKKPLEAALEHRGELGAALHSKLLPLAVRDGKVLTGLVTRAVVPAPEPPPPARNLLGEAGALCAAAGAARWSVSGCKWGAGKGNGKCKDPL